MYTLKDYQYILDDSRIAQEPAYPVDASKLLVPDGTSFHDKHFYDLPSLLTSKDVLFFNDTKVVKARVPLQDVFVEIPHHTSASRSVEKGEVFFLELKDLTHFEGLVTLTKRIRKGSIIHITREIKLIVEDLTDKGVLFEMKGTDVWSFFDTYGQMPLPPYITYNDEKAEQYQTVFADADKKGSVAAPTASLHFTEKVLQQLQEKGIRSHHVTLHVGLGTFKPVDTDDIRSYQIHQETIIVDEDIFHKVSFEKQQERNIIAVGTTVARTLETLPYLYKAMQKTGNGYFDRKCASIDQEEVEKYIVSWKQKGTKIICETRIFIYPGFTWKVVDGLITNFHLPGSTLLMLVASFIGYDQMVQIYNHAIDNNYRFFSFGDAMLLRR